MSYLTEYYENVELAKQLHDGLTAEEHSRRAEKLLAGTWRSSLYAGRSDEWKAPTEYALASAQVHATLAVARAAIETRQATIDAPKIRPAVPR
jgi:hypothetical protein